MTSKIAHNDYMEVDDAADNTEEVQNNRGPIKQLNTLLSSEATRMRGMRMMTAKICPISKDEFIVNCVKWMQICVNSDDITDKTLALNNLGMLIKRSAFYAELNGPVSNFLKSKFFPKFFISFSSFNSGWKCVHLCLQHYKGSCNAHHGRLKQEIVQQLEKKFLSETMAQVYALLPSIGDSGDDGVNLIKKWKNQFEDILKICNSILHDLFKDVVESQTYQDEPCDSYCSLSVINESILYKLFYNYSLILQFMLLCPYPASKSIVPQKVLVIICRCLGVTTKSLGQFDTTQKIRLRDLLPQFHIVTISLLNALIATCKTNFLPFSKLLTKLINQTVQSNEGFCSSNENDMRVRLRISAYETWTRWISVSAGGGAIGSDSLMLAALKDISLETVNQKEANNVECEDKERYKWNDELIKLLCFSALKVLQVYVRELGALLKPEQLKEVQMCIIKRILNIQRSQPVNSPFTSSKCRYELYSLLMELVNCQCLQWPSPVNWALELFKQGAYDPASEVASLCSASIKNVTNIIDQEVIRVFPADTIVMGAEQIKV